MVKSTTLEYQFLLAGYYDDFNGARVIPNDDNRPSLTVSYDHDKTHYGNPLNGEATTNTRYRWSYADRAQLGSNLVATASNKFLKNTGPAEWLTFDVMRNDPNKWEGRSQLQYPDSNTNANKYEFGAAGTTGYITFCNGHDTGGSYTVPTGDNDASQGRATRSPYTIVNYDAGSTSAPATSGSAAAAYGSIGGNFIQTAHLTGVWMGERNYDFRHFSTGGATENPELLYMPHRSPAGKPFLCIEARHTTATGYISSSVPRPAIAYDGLLNSRQDNDTFALRFAIQSLRGENLSGEGNEPKMTIHIGFPSSKEVDGEKGFTTNTNTAAIEWDIDLAAGTPANNGLGGTYDFTNTMTTWDAANYDAPSLWIDLEFVIDYTNNQYTVYKDGTAIKNTSGASGPFTMNNNSDTSAAFNPSELKGWQIETIPQTSDTKSLFVLMLDRAALYQSLTERADGTQLPPIQKMSVNSAVNSISRMQLQISDDPGMNTGTGAVGLRDQDYTHFLNNIFTGSVNDWSLLLFHNGLDRPLWWGFVDNMTIKQGPKSRTITLNANDPLGILDRQVPLWELGQGARNTSEQGIAYWTQESQTFNTAFHLGAAPLKTLRPTIGLDVDDSYVLRTDQRTQVVSGMPIQMYNNEESPYGPNNVEDDYEGIGILGIGQESSTGDTRVYLDGNPGYTTSSTVNIEKTTSHNATGIQPQAVGTYTLNGITNQYLDFDSGDLAYVFDATPRYIYAGKYIWDGQGIPTTANAAERNYYSFIFLGDPGLDVGDTFVVPEVKGHTQIQDKVHTVLSSGEFSNFSSINLAGSSRPGYYTGATNTTAGGSSVTRGYNKIDLGSESFTDSTRTAGPKLYVVVTDCVYGSSGAEYGTFSNAVATTTLASDVQPGSSSISLTSASGFNSSGSAAKPATINTSVNMINFFTYTGVSTDDLTGVPTSGDNAIRGPYFTLGGAPTITQPGWLYSTDRGIISSDRGIVTPIPTSLTDISQRAAHAVWMRDLPHSLWFQYHFGRMDGTGSVGLSASNKTGKIQAAVSSGDKTIKISSTLYAALPSFGVGQLGTTLTHSSTNSIKDQLDNMVDLDTFIYKGKATAGGHYYLIGCDFISRDHDDQSFIGIADIGNDYKHCWLLWADMRNDGTADADGNKRQQQFGIIEPTIDNYEVELFYADQVDADGNPDAFTDLKLGQDIDLWEVDVTADPSTRGAFSKPPDYSTGAAVSGIADASGALRLTVTAGHGVVANDYIHVFNSVSHNGVYEVSAVTSTTITLGSGTYVAADSGNTGGIHFCKVVGSETETNSVFHDWESKAGSLLIVDSAKFFNLNTTTNNGRFYNKVGGRTSLGDYVSTREGFPSLIDNYWQQATASHLTVDAPYSTHRNSARLAISSSLVDGSIFASDRHIELEDGSVFDKSGVGRVISVKGENTTTNYILWQERVKAPHTGSVTSSSAPTATKFLLVDSSADFSALEEAITKEQFPKIKNTTTGETSIIVGYTNSTTITVAKNTFVGLSPPFEDLDDYPTISGWGSITNGNEYVIPMQLINVYGTSLSNVANASSATYSEIETAIQEEWLKEHVYRTRAGTTFALLPLIEFSMEIGTGQQQFDSIGVVNTIGSPYSLRMLMRVRGFVESPNQGTYYESDKMRMLWNAALMKTWLPRTRLSCIHDISNVPNTTMMAVEGTTASATQDDFGSVFDARTKTFLATIRGMQGTSGLGRTQENQLNFAYLVGRDGRIDFRPRYNSGFAFDRSNLMLSDMKTDMGGLVTHVRVYYKNGQSFCDFPRPSLSDTTRWKIVEMPGVANHAEAEQIAKHEYRKAQKTRLSITAEPIRSSTETNKMLSGGRFGYIADTQRLLDGLSGNNMYDMFSVGMGFSPFPGMVNGMDGNLKTTSGSIRYGQAAPYTAIGTSGTPARTSYDEHYYSYGANSLSYAMQVVHIPKDMPYVSDTTNNELRCFVVLKEQEVTSIDEAEFHLVMADYSFSNSTTGNGGGTSPSAALAPSLAGSEANAVTTVTVKNSGFYQLTVPQTYSSTLNSAGAKIVVSFNAEYCRGLLRHRCGDPTQTAHGSSGYILDNAHVLTGISALAYTAGNDNSLFPLGGRKYSEFGDFAYGRSEWYAPRLHVVNDVKFVPGTFATYTDKALQLNNETLVIQRIGWETKGRDIETVMLQMERDMNLPPSGILPYIATMGINPRTGSSSGDGGSGTDSPQPTPYPDTNGPGDGAGGYGGSFPGLDPLPGSGPTPSFPTGGVTPPTNSPGGGHSPSFGANQLTSGIYGNMTGRMALDSDIFSGQGSFSVLGQKKPSPLPSMMFPATNSGLGNIAPAFGGATKGDGEMVLPGVGNSDNTGDSSSGIESSVTVPLNVVSESVNLTAVVSCASNSVGSQKAVLNCSIECIETGATLTNDIMVSVGTSKQTIDLIPNNLLNGASTVGNKLRVVVSRTPEFSADTANYHSVKIHSLDVLFDQAAFNTPGLNQQFKSFS
jgi:hypothetical protein